MDARKKALWVEALRSGDYKQSQYTLQDRRGFCCLGVLCEVAVKDGLDLEVSVDETGVHTYGGTRVELPAKVQSWAGLEGGDPFLGQMTAMRMNDGLEWTFEDIADQIDREV